MTDEKLAEKAKELERAEMERKRQEEQTKQQKVHACLFSLRVLSMYTTVLGRYVIGLRPLLDR